MDKFTTLKGKYIYEDTNDEKKGFTIEIKVSSKGGQLESHVISQIEQQYMNTSNNILQYRKIVKE